MAEHSRIGIVGLGYVGLPLPLQSAGSGCRVQDFDRQGATQIAI
jgi:UDP-N-acetyl-D-mannosaminuronate dehydrogenase